MPLVEIGLVAGRTSADKRAISDAVHTALVDAFRIPDDDYNHRIQEYKPEDFIRPPGKSDRYILIEMTVFPGRSRDAKTKLYAEIGKRLTAMGVDSKDFLIVLHEPGLPNWGVSGGVPADQVDLGFKLNV